MPDTRDPVHRRTLESAPHRGGPRVRRQAGAGDSSSEKDLRPIGRERLRELRESIRNGTYPTDQNVERALLTMFLGTPARGPARPRSGSEEGV